MIKIYTVDIILQNNVKFIEIGHSKEKLLIWDSFLSPNKDSLCHSEKV